MRAVVNAGPREDSTRVGAGGIVRRQAVDVSPFRRVNQALYLIGMGAREASFRTVKTIAECLADEIFNASKGSSNSYAIKKKDEIERVRASCSGPCAVSDALALLRPLFSTATPPRSRFFRPSPCAGEQGQSLRMDAWGGGALRLLVRVLWGVSQCRERCQCPRPRVLAHE